jgi:hypothetical protein
MRAINTLEVIMTRVLASPTPLHQAWQLWDEQKIGVGVQLFSFHLHGISIGIYSSTRMNLLITTIASVENCTALIGTSQLYSTKPNLLSATFWTRLLNPCLSLSHITSLHRLDSRSLLSQEGREGGWSRSSCSGLRGSI